MRNQRKKLVGFFIAAAVFLLAALPAYAAGNGPRIVELKQREDKLLAFVRDAGSSGGLTAALGKTPCENVSSQTILEAGMELHTLILIDNSLSIPEDNRVAIQEKLLELAAARRENESFSLGTISDHVTILADFTKDYMQVKNAFESLSYQYQDTFLTDALYDYLMTDPFAESGDAFERILLVSDGVDNKSLGYTKDELLSVLKDSPLPIYAMGIQNWNESNDEELENMFALARAAKGESFLLSDVTDGAVSLTAVMDGDWNNLAVTVDIPKSVQDGSLQTLTLRFGEGGAAASLDNIRMPLSEEQPPAAEPPKAEIEPEPDITPEPEPEPEPEFPVIPVILAAAAGAVALIGLIIFFVRKNKRPEPPDSELPDPEPKPKPDRQTVPSAPPASGGGAGRRTILVGGAADGGAAGGRRTVRIMNKKTACTVTLKDVNNPDKFFQKTIETSLVVGAYPESDICIGYDGTVSGKHCEIILEGGDLYLVNHSRSNGTELNGQTVTQKTRLNSGDRIKMGLVEMYVTFQL